MDYCTHAVGYREELFGEVRGLQNDVFLFLGATRACGWGGGGICEGVGKVWWWLEYGGVYYTLVGGINACDKVYHWCGIALKRYSTNM